MLEHLYISNFVLINELTLDFHQGFSAFIGETGAGKSIMVDAISLLCADRASSDLIAKGKNKAIIEGTFNLAGDQKAIQVLEELGIETDNTVTFTREILATGKSVARINHRIVTLNVLKECLENHVDIHSQHDNQYLLNPQTHIHLLDRFCHDENELNDVKIAYAQYDQLLKEKETFLSTQFNESDLEFFQFQLKELENAKLDVDEEEQLLQKEQQYKATKGSYDRLKLIMEGYETVDSDFFALNKKIQNLPQDLNVESEKEIINSSYYEFVDAMERIKKLFSNFDMSEDDINQLEERLYTLQRLKRKYNLSIADLIKKQDDLKENIERFSCRDLFIKEIDQKIGVAKKNFDEKAIKLSNIRKSFAKQLDEEVGKQLHDLELKNAVFQTRISNIKENPYGIDHVEFYVQMNAGQPFSPLHKTASGGEISRLMLGLKVIFSSLQGIQTIIFDEIDTGVSGNVAFAIGKKMKMLAKQCQVFSVTHLAPVASNSDTLYLVSKNTNDQYTSTMIHQLNYQETLEQLAKIAYGSVSNASIQAASELYERSHKDE